MVEIFDVTEHDGERLLDAAFAFAERGYSRFRTCITGEMETTQSFYGGNAIFFEQMRGLPQGLGGVDERAIGRPELQQRTAIPASVRLRMKTAIGGIIVFGLTRGAHAKGSHGGARTVVRDVANDGEARTAVGAVDEGVAEAAVARIQHFAETVVADGHIGRDEGFGRSIEAAGEDAEGSFGLRLGVARKKRSDFCQGRSFGGETFEEAIKLVGLALNLNGYAGWRVGDEADEIALLCEAIDERTEAYTLHDAGDVDDFASDKRSGRCVHEGIIAESCKMRKKAERVA